MNNRQNTKQNGERADIYQKVTDAIVVEIEHGVGSWVMPWHTAGELASIPVNALTRKLYRGVNILVLIAAAKTNGYDYAEWATYQQWQDVGAQVRKGEKSSSVVFWKFSDSGAEEQDSDTEETSSTRSRLVCCREYHVFNVAQVDGYTPQAAETQAAERIAEAEEFFGSIDADVVHSGNRAYYSAATDTITLPSFSAFFTATDYYSTRAHEMAHWTSRKDRCDRELGKRFGDNAYAMEELVAELAAAFTMAHLGLSSQPREDHATYSNSWLKVLKADKRAVFTAASKAQQAADFIVAQSERARATSLAA